jgi:hypothetical protein
MGIWDSLDFGFRISDWGFTRFWILDFGLGIDKNKEFYPFIFG